MADQPNVRVKICGFKDPAEAVHAVDSGASYIGLTFFAKSKRAIDPACAARIVNAVGDRVTKVALLVNPDDELVDCVTSLGADMLQLHGSETIDRVRSVRQRTSLPIMKALGIRSVTDLPAIDAYSPYVDQLLVDAKPPDGDAVPGGHGVAFDWRLLTGRTWTVPWMLAGGLKPESVAEAIRLTGATQVDVASGVERSPGDKDPDKVTHFIDRATNAII